MTKQEAIDALDLIPDMIINCDDYHEVYKALDMATEALREKPTKKTGYWIEHKRAEIYDGLLQSNFECSECHDWLRDKTDYCPSCGSYNRE